MNYDFIEKLPDDIKKKIFYDYLEIEVIYNEIMTIINDEKEKENYNIDGIVKILNYILVKKILTNYFYDNDYDFQHAYNYHIIKNKKKFNLLSSEESFALHWTFWI